jgi:hypothetical protein
MKQEVTLKEKKNRKQINGKLYNTDSDDENKKNTTVKPLFKKL